MLKSPKQSGHFPNWILTLLGCVLFASLSSSWAKLSSPQQVTAELKKIQAEINQLQFSLKTSQKREIIFERSLRAIDLKISNTSKQRAALSEKIEQLNKKNKQHLHTRDVLEQELSRQKKQLTKQLSLQYTMGKQAAFRVLLSTENLKTAQRMLAYLKYFHEARLKKITLHQQTLVKLQTIERDIVEQKSALAKALKQQSVADANYRKERKERADILNTVRQEIHHTDSKLSDLNSKENGLLELFKKLKNALSDIPKTLGNNKKFSSLKGGLAWPTKGKIAVRFGSARLNSAMKWNGIIIAAQEQETVSTVYGGRIAYADWLRGFGLLMIVDHGDGYMTLYAHNQSLYKEVGDWVEAGDIIAQVGKTGALDTSGLYFEIRHNGKPLNPSKWMTRKWVSAKK